jgi:hypothetical protein
MRIIINMPHKVCFSIACHESPDCVLDLIENIQWAMPGSCIVLHINANSDEKFFKNVYGTATTYPGIYINPVRHPIAWSNGMLLQAHMSNYKFAADYLRFEYFWLEASNTMFVSDLALNYVNQYDYGVISNPVVLNGGWIWSQAAFMDARLLAMIKSINPGGLIYGGPSEGAFFKKEIMDIIYSKIAPFLPLEPTNYPREETFIHSVISNLDFSMFKQGVNLTRPFVPDEYIDKALEDDVEWIIANNAYAMKPFPREYNHPRRIKIRQKIQALKAQA